MSVANPRGSFVRVFIAVIIATAIIAMAGCEGGLRPAVPKDSPSSPFVEAFIEYVGPPDRWAGPRTATLRLLAREENASVLLALLPGRSPAPGSGGALSTAAGQIAQGLLRAELQQLGSTMLETPVDFSGCMYPIRARLVRADGSVFERQGCRTNSGWPIAAGRTVSKVLDSAKIEGFAPRAAQLAGGRTTQ
jgi:hypothetical protein